MAHCCSCRAVAVPRGEGSSTDGTTGITGHPAPGTGLPRPPGPPCPPVSPRLHFSLCQLLLARRPCLAEQVLLCSSAQHREADSGCRSSPAGVRARLDPAPCGLGPWKRLALVQRGEIWSRRLLRGTKVAWGTAPPWLAARLCRHCSKLVLY